MSRQREKEQLFFELGLLFGPLLKMKEHPERYESDERARILARYFAEWDVFVNRVEKFTRGEPGCNYMTHYHRVHNLCYGIINHATNHPENTEGLLSLALQNSSNIREVISSIPVPLESAIHEAVTPFSTCCFVRDLCLSAAKEIAWADRYMDCCLFHRFLRDIAAKVVITLVTWPENRLTGSRDRARFTEFLDISRLFAAERGPDGYRLIANEDFHDRWLRCDEGMFVLGGSIKDLGREPTFTISRLDATVENKTTLDGVIAGGTVLFGPGVPKHP